MKIRNIIGGILLVALSGCGHFLDEYSQTFIRASKISDYDELLLGSVYIKSIQPNIAQMYYVYPSGNNVCGFFNVLDDDVSTVCVDEYTMIGGDRPYFAWEAMNPSLFGYMTWQRDITDTDVATTDDQATWVDLYKRIAVINSTLEEIDDLDISTDEETADYHRVKGECLFLRGQFYFILANLYGKPYNPSTASSDLGVPLKITSGVEHDKDLETQFNRATLDVMYTQIVEDLQGAVENLGMSSKNVWYRASEEAARILLSRVYLYMQRWDDARSVLEPVFDQITLCSLVSGDTLNSDNRFLTEENPEIIFSQSSLYSQVCWTANAPDLCVSHELYNLFDENDRRRGCFTTNMETDSIALSYKYNTGNFQSQVSDVLMIRAAEAYLNMAEACAISGTDEASANTYLNTLRRNRIVGYEDQSYSGEELVSQIRTERRKELCYEGHRWFDLRRYSVCEKYPYKKRIYRQYALYDADGRLTSNKTYVLEEDDPAYVFAIPKNVLEFDATPMPDNERPERNPID